MIFSMDSYAYTLIHGLEVDKVEKKYIYGSCGANNSQSPASGKTVQGGVSHWW